MLRGVVNAASCKAVEIGAGGMTVCGRVPELVVTVDVLCPEDHTACAVEDNKGVVRVALVFDQSGDDKAIVMSVAVGGDEVGELEEAVTVVAVPEDVEVIVDDAVAARFVDKDKGQVADGVGEEAVEECPRELAFDDGVVEGGIAVGIDEKEAGDYAVLPLAALQGDVKDCVGVDGDTVERIGQLVRTNVCEGSVVDVGDDGEVIIEDGVAVGRCTLYQESVDARSVHRVAIDDPWQVVLHHCVGARKGVVGTKSEGVVAQGVASKGMDAEGVTAGLGEGEAVPRIRQLVATDSPRDRVEDQTTAVGSREQDAVGRGTATSHLNAAEAIGAGGVVIGGRRFVEAEYCPSSWVWTHVEIDIAVDEAAWTSPYRRRIGEILEVKQCSVAQRDSMPHGEETGHCVVDIKGEIKHRYGVERVGNLRGGEVSEM